MKLSELAGASKWPYGLVLSEEAVETQAINAARQFQGWGTLASIDPPEAIDPGYPSASPSPPLDGIIVGYLGGVYGGAPKPPVTPEPPAPVPALDSDTDITDSEWAIIKPLFLLYVERANALALEASRSLGVEVYGRLVDTIENDIQRYEQVDMPRLAFSQQWESI